jgi:hypothetical protein
MSIRGQGQFGNPDERERPPLEAVARRLVKTVTEDSRMRVTVNCIVCIRVVYKSSVILITNPNSVYR